MNLEQASVVYQGNPNFKSGNLCGGRSKAYNDYFIAAENAS